MAVPISALTPEPADLAGTVSKRAVRYLKAQVEDWYDTCRGLTAWEERHLVDGPSSQQLDEHGRFLDELERVGRWMAQATQSSDFPDQAVAELIKMTLQDLKDRRSLWHGSLTAAQRKQTLRDIFNES